MVILVVDNYDSFTWNIVHYLKELGATVELLRNDEASAADMVERGAEAFLISPGPGTPEEAGVSLELVGLCARRALPLLGICLGHQAIGQHFGGRVIRTERPVHGNTCWIMHDGTGLFAGLPSPFTATRYHSHAVSAESLPDCLVVNATADDATLQGFRHRKLPIHGVQFHPESVASEWGHELIGNFLREAARTRA